MTGAPSRALLAHPIDHRLHAVFRIRRPNRTADTPVDPIFESTRPDTVLTLKPRKADPAPSGSSGSSGPPNSDGVLLTTLLDDTRTPGPARADLYHQRGSIEELYKTVKQTLSMPATGSTPPVLPPVLPETRRHMETAQTLLIPPDQPLSGALLKFIPPKN